MERYNPLSPVETLEKKKQQALNQCDHLIRDFGKRGDRHKHRYRRLQFISIGLTAFTTILSALSASNVLGALDWIVLSVSGLATLATTLLSQTNAQHMWVQSRNMSQKFQMELFLYLQHSGGYANTKDEADTLKLFSERLMNIWSDAQDVWSQQASLTK